MKVRPARVDESEAIARLINTAYEVERFFVEGERTSPDEIRRLMTQGTFVVSVDDGDAVVACIYVETTTERSYFGMLAVEPLMQGRGLARQLIDEAERRARAAGSVLVEIHVVNLRVELLQFYSRLGYVEIGTAPYVDRRVTRPCNFVVMHKSFDPVRSPA